MLWHGAKRTVPLFIEGRARRAEGVTSKARSKSLTAINSSQFLSTTKYFVLATIFFVSTTISDQSRLANSSELSVRKITDLWQKHHSCLIIEQPFREKGLSVSPRTNSPFFRNTKPFWEARLTSPTDTECRWVTVTYLVRYKESPTPWQKREETYI